MTTLSIIILLVNALTNLYKVGLIILGFYFLHWAVTAIRNDVTFSTDKISQWEYPHKKWAIAGLLILAISALLPGKTVAYTVVGIEAANLVISNERVSSLTDTTIQLLEKKIQDILKEENTAVKSE